MRGLARVETRGFLKESEFSDRAFDGDRAIAVLQPLGIRLGFPLVRGLSAQVSKQVLEALFLVVSARLNGPPELHDFAGALVIRRQRLFVMLVQRLFCCVILGHDLGSLALVSWLLCMFVLSAGYLRVGHNGINLEFVLPHPAT